MATERSGFVFIAYKREEASKAQELRNSLTREGFSVWWDAEIQCGQEWAQALDDAVRDAACVMVLWSKRSISSPWVRHEASQAIARRVYLPCRIDLVPLEPPFERIQASDLIEWQGDRAHGGFRNMIARLNELIPPPSSLPKRVAAALWKNRLLAASLVFAVLAFTALLSIQTSVQERRKDAAQEATALLEDRIYNCANSPKTRGRAVTQLLFIRRRDNPWWGVQWEDACLDDIDLTAANFSSANLAGASLRNATLYRCNLTGANLTAADLTGASLEKTNLSGAVLLGTRGLTQDQLDSACAHDKRSPPRLPEGLVWRSGECGTRPWAR